ncbi:hypothetical protein EDD17DRAFT_1757056 [Pisolithus thermaeus]|nr:hypothetical protein EDD17DRAFT_1757056 [Pisolithus thermaeus]
MNPLDTIKKGLNILKEQTHEQKTRLKADLQAKKKLSEEDEQWLDGEGNLVDEEHIVGLLERTLDYEKSLMQLDSDDKQVIQKLQDLANASSKGPGKKCKHGVLNTSAKKRNKDTCSTAKENATLAQQIEILDWHHEQKKSQQETAMYFNIKYPSLQLKQHIISAWLKDEEKWCQ